MASPISSIFTLLIVFIIIYVGYTVLYAVNPLLAILFVLMGLYLAFRSTGGRGR
jgi:hypothetical protein